SASSSSASSSAILARMSARQVQSKPTAAARSLICVARVSAGSDSGTSPMTLVTRYTRTAKAAQGEQHARGCAPDHPLSVRDVTHFYFDFAAPETPHSRAPVRGLEDVFQRHFERALHFFRVDEQLEIRAYEGDDRRDPKSGDHDVVRKVS